MAGIPNAVTALLDGQRDALNERFAARQSDAANPARNEALGKFAHFLYAEHRRFG